ncbi:MAG: PfkB family carbohydrate kinase [Ignavibacteria bacterium]|nr:PfkB family carbohydrate kinase [Ignavibacteria bacterium]
MILTVTINPLLEICLNHKSVSFNAENRNGKLLYRAGGKGINVNRQLKYLETKSFGFTFAGGANGKIFRSVLEHEELSYSFIRTAAETRIASVITDESNKSVSTYFQENNIVSSDEANEFKLKLDKMIQNCEIVVFSGSSPSTSTDDIFPYGISLANKYDKVSVVDTYGTHLANCIDASPTILHNNAEEIEKSLQVKMKSEKDKLAFLDHLYQKGIKQAFITDGELPIFASNFDYHFKIVPPKVSAVHPTGSGDAFVAGVVYGWHNDFVFAETCKLASALGAANAERLDICAVDFASLEELRKQINVMPIGKKMKLLDDSPQ